MCVSYLIGCEMCNLAIFCLLLCKKCYMTKNSKNSWMKCKAESGQFPHVAPLNKTNGTHKKKKSNKKKWLIERKITLM